MGFQFAHLETYSRKPKEGRGTAFIFAENGRRPEASVHVAAPRPPVVVYGQPVEAVERLHDERAAAAKTATKAGRRRAIRNDQHTLATVVLSHPCTWAEVRADPAKAAEVEAWEARSIAWLKAQFGDQLAAVVRHDDEAHPHLHALILPADVEMRARMLHPGVEAKTAAKEAALAEGHDAKTANKLGDAAYKQAMRDWQDSYHREVGAPCGLTRLGPGRRRLTRAEWQAEQAAGRAALVVEAATEQARRELSALEAKAAEVRQQARQHVQGARQRIEAAQATEAKAKGLAEHAKTIGRQADQAKREAAAVEARHRGLGSRIGLMLAGLVGWRQTLEARHQRRLDQARQQAEERVAKVSEATEGTVARLERQARQAEAEAAKAKAEAEAARLEVARQRQLVQATARERDAARSAYADAAHALDGLRRGGPAHGLGRRRPTCSPPQSQDC